MEKDVNILNAFLLANIPEIITQEEFDEVKQALENLIKGYRELEEKNKYWNDRIEYAKKDTKGLKMYEMGMAWEDMKEDLEKSIPKSKVKEKIEELESYKGLVMFKKYNYEVIINHLQELMEDK